MGSTKIIQHGRKMVTLLQKIYEKVQSAVRIGRHQGEWFHTDVETRQGDSLSPLLFIGIPRTSNGSSERKQLENKARRNASK